MPATNFDAVSLPGGALNPNSQGEYFFFGAGAQTTGALKGQYLVCCASTIIGVQAALGTAPTGAAFIVDLLKNGVSLYTTTANRPTIAIAGTLSTALLPDTVTLAPGDLLSYSILQIGSGTAGSNLSFTVAVKRVSI